MARFIGKIQGARGAVTRLGHHAMHAEVNGWGAGVKAMAFRDAQDRDGFEVWMTWGSRAERSPELIGHVQDTDAGPVGVPAEEGKPCG